VKKQIKFISGYCYLLLAYLLMPLTWLNFKQQLWLGKQLGLLLLRLDKRSKNIATTNINIAFANLPKEEKAQLLRDSFIAMGISALEGIALLSPFRKRLLTRLRSIQGLEAVHQSIANGHSVLLLFPHLTSVYFAGYLLIKKTGLPCAIQYNPPRNPVIARVMQKKLEACVYPAFTRDHLQRIVTYLRKPNILWYAPDLDLGSKRSLFIDFFNFPAGTSIVTHFLAAKTSAKTFTIAFYRNEEGQYDIDLQPLAGFGEGPVRTDLQRLNQRIEDIVRLKPEQYLWQYKRYNTRPEGEEKLYRKTVN
jgi:KDO2-lipid IV(A) lauroyltransferase